MLNIFITIAVAALGSFLFYKLKIPAGAVIGSIVFSAAFNVFTGAAAFPMFTKAAVQAIAGGFVGQRITMHDLREMKGIILASIEMLVCMLLFTLITGSIIHHFYGLSLATSLIATMPAGLSDTVIISSDLGGDATQTTVLQLVRLLVSILLLPQIAFQVCHRVESNSDSSVIPSLAKSNDICTLPNIARTVLVAECSGIAGKLFGIPAGAMIFSIFAVAALNIKTGKACLPKSMRLIAQCCIGVIVGCRISKTDVLNFRQLLLPALTISVSLLIFNYIVGCFIYKTNHLDFSTCIFASIPAGLSDMALISTEMGGDAPKVAVLHLVRYVGVLTLMPAIIKLLT